MSDDTSHHQRNVFFGLPILGFFRPKRRVDASQNTGPSPTFHSAIEQQQQDENSSLLYHSAVAPTVRFQEEEPPRQKKSPKELWGILREHVMDESFHLEDWRTKTERVRTRDQEKHFSEMTLPYEFGVIHCVAAWVVYLGISIVAYSYVFEQWTAIEAAYYACVSFTTIGYGDYTPTTKGGRIFCCFFALAGVCVLGIALGIVGSKIIESEVETLQKAEQKVTQDVFKIFSRDMNSKSLKRNESSGSFAYLSDHESFHDEDNDPKWKQTLTWWRSFCALLCRYTPALAPLFLGAYFIARYEGWELDETVYYMVVTTTTIGYGDYVPERESTKLFAVFYIPLAVGAMGHFLGTIANFIIDKRREHFDKKLWSHEISLEDLAAMDEGKDGYVTEVEFLAFMLVAMKKVDKELIDRIREHFRYLDLTNSGTLVRKDLELMAKKKLRTARSKLRLAQYKTKLESFCDSSHHQVV
jgi:potassium channel subfamily K